MNATKYTFDTEFRPEGDLISNAARARQKKSYSHDEIDQLCARAREQGLKAGQVRAQEAIAAGALDVVSVLRDVLARTSKEVEQVRADAAGIALIAARKLARAALATLPGVALDVIADVPFAEMPWAYAACDALVCTSLDEGSPNCVKEALACGLSVVSVDVGDVPELLSGLTNCEVVPADPQAIGRALQRTIADGRGCPDGPARIRAGYSLEAVAAEFTRFWREVARGDGTRAIRISSAA